MPPHKYPEPRDRKQNVIGFDLLRSDDSEPTPFFASWEIDRFNLWGWSNPSGRWMSLERLHTPLSVIPIGETEPSAWGKARWNWSERVALAKAGRELPEDLIAAVYKRELSAAEGGLGLYVDLIRYSPANDAGPVLDLHIKVPLNGLKFADSGYSLWAGIYERQLYILTQTFESASSDSEGVLLTLLVGRIDDLSRASSWHSVVVAKGGWDLDARLDGDRIRAIYRKRSESIRITNPGTQTGEITISLAGANSDSLFVELQLSTIALSDESIRHEDFPGGEHPRIQRIDPLLITVERPNAGNIRFRNVFNQTTNQLDTFSTWASSTTATHLFLQRATGLVRGVISAFSSSFVPRNVVPFARVLDAFRTSPTVLAYQSLLSRYPLHILQAGSDPRSIQLDVLQQRARLGLFRTRLQGMIVGDVVTFSEVGADVWDINHAHIGDPTTLTPDASIENTQFQATPINPDGPTNWGVRFLDNTIGGALLTERSAAPWRYFAYCDLGDGGARVVLEANTPPPDPPPLTPDIKDLTPAAVPGPGLGSDTWVEIAPPPGGDWIASALPGQLVTTLDFRNSINGSVHRRLDSVLDFANQLSASATINVAAGFTDASLDTVQASMLSSDPLGNPTTSNAAVLPIASFRFKPTAPMASSPVTLEGTLQGETGGTFVWTVLEVTVPMPAGGPASFTLTGPSPTVTLPRAGDWRITLVVTRSNGTTRTATTTITGVLASIAQTLWGFHASLSTPGVVVGNATMTFLKYNFAYSVASGATPRSINITELPTHDSRFRFLRNGLQQGDVEYQDRITFSSSAVALTTPTIASIVTVNSIGATFFFGRRFTPCVLTSDQRTRDPLTRRQGVEEQVARLNGGLQASALSAKPSGNSVVELGTTTASVSLTPAAMTMAILVPALAALGVAGLAAVFVGLFVSLNAAITLGFFGLGLAIAIAITIALLLVLVVVPLIQNFVRGLIGGAITAPRMRVSLDGSDMMEFAGEGLAEALARQFIQIANAANPAVAPPDADGAARNRFRDQFWQIIVTTENRCRALIRA